MKILKLRHPVQPSIEVNSSLLVDGTNEIRYFQYLSFLTNDETTLGLFRSVPFLAVGFNVKETLGFHSDLAHAQPSMHQIKMKMSCCALTWIIRAVVVISMVILVQTGLNSTKYTTLNGFQAFYLRTFSIIVHFGYTHFEISILKIVIKYSCANIGIQSSSLHLSTCFVQGSTIHCWPFRIFRRTQ